MKKNMWYLPSESYDPTGLEVLCISFILDLCKFLVGNVGFFVSIDFEIKPS